MASETCLRFRGVTSRCVEFPEPEGSIVCLGKGTISSKTREELEEVYEDSLPKVLTTP